MKKVLIIFLGIIIFSISGCGHGSINEITIKDYNEMVENKDNFILFIGSHNCSHCTEYRVTLEEVIKKYNINFNYLDVANLTDEEYEKFTKEIIFTGTPTTVFIEEGKDNSCNVFSCDSSKRIDGALSYDEIIQILKNKGYIKE